MLTVNHFWYTKSDHTSGKYSHTVNRLDSPFALVFAATEDGERFLHTSMCLEDGANDSFEECAARLTQVPGAVPFQEGGNVIDKDHHLNGGEGLELAPFLFYRCAP